MSEAKFSVVVYFNFFFILKIKPWSTLEKNKKRKKKTNSKWIIGSSDAKKLQCVPPSADGLLNWNEWTTPRRAHLNAQSYVHKSHFWAPKSSEYRPLSGYTRLQIPREISSRVHLYIYAAGMDEILPNWVSGNWIRWPSDRYSVLDALTIGV